MESDLKPEYIEKLKRIKKEKGIAFKSIDELKRILSKLP